MCDEINDRVDEEAIEKYNYENTEDNRETS